MASNSISPGWMKVRYNTNGHDHFQTLPCIPVDPTPGIIPTLMTKGGTPNADPATWLEDIYMPAMGQFMRALDSFIEVEFWSKPTPASDPVFLAVAGIAVVGSNVGATTPNGQGVLSMRTVAGGIFKWFVMEGANVVVNIHDPRPFSDARVTNMQGILTSSGSLVCGRDNAFPLIGIAWNTKTNDALRKKYVMNV